VDDLTELVRRDCGFGTASIFLNGARLAPQLEWLGPVHQQVGLHPSLATSEVLLVYQGVVVARTTPSLSLPLRAVVSNDSFTLNASHSDVVQDEVLQEALAGVEAAGRRCLEELVANYQPEKRLAAFLRGRLSPEKRSGRWWDLPIFPLADGRLASARQLEEQSNRLGLVPVCASAPPGTDLLLAVPQVEADLRRLFGDLVGPGEQRALESLSAQANRRAWEGRPREAVLKLGRFLARSPVEGGHYRGEVALEAQDADHPARGRI